jgi:hypothetical protein
MFAHSIVRTLVPSRSSLLIAGRSRRPAWASAALRPLTHARTLSGLHFSSSSSNSETSKKPRYQPLATSYGVQRPTYQPTDTMGAVSGYTGSDNTAASQVVSELISTSQRDLQRNYPAPEPLEEEAIANEARVARKHLLSQSGRRLAQTPANHVLSFKDFSNCTLNDLVLMGPNGVRRVFRHALRRETGRTVDMYSTLSQYVSSRYWCSGSWGTGVSWWCSTCVVSSTTSLFCALASSVQESTERGKCFSPCAFCPASCSFSFFPSSLFWIQQADPPPLDELGSILP